MGISQPFPSIRTQLRTIRTALGYLNIHDVGQDTVPKMAAAQAGVAVGNRPAGNHPAGNHPVGKGDTVLGEAHRIRDLRTAQAGEDLEADPTALMAAHRTLAGGLVEERCSQSRRVGEE